MKKLHIGNEIALLGGKPMMFSEDGVERTTAVRDLLVQLYPRMSGKGKENSLSLSATMHKIYDCKEDFIELEDHDASILEGAIEGTEPLAWVQTAITEAFVE